MNDFLDAQVIVYTHKGESLGLKNWQPAFFLCNTKRSCLFEEPTLFLFEEYVRNGHSPSVHTWASAADAMKSWFQWLQAIQKPWQEAVRQDRLDYCDAYMTTVSPRTGQPYAPGTVASRMRVVKQFYQFAHSHGWYEGDLATGGADTGISTETPLGRNSMAHQKWDPSKLKRDRDLPKVRPKVVIHPLQVKDLRNLIYYCGPRAASRNGDLRPSRDRLFVDLGWVVGLRVEEIHSLSVLQFLGMHPDPDAPHLDQAMIVNGKGGRSRHLAIPGWLVEDALAYITGERQEALKLGKVSNRNASNLLFLSGVGSKRPGRPISIRRLQQIIETACLAIGLTKTIEVRDAEEGTVSKKLMQKHSVHDLRHTAAVLIYHAERKAGNSEPWKKVQMQLGHKHLQTTIDTYLHHVEIFGQQQQFYDVRKMIGL